MTPHCHRSPTRYFALPYPPAVTPTAMPPSLPNTAPSTASSPPFAVANPALAPSPSSSPSSAPSATPPVPSPPSASSSASTPLTTAPHRSLPQLRSLFSALRRRQPCPHPFHVFIPIIYALGRSARLLAALCLRPSYGCTPTIRSLNSDVALLALLALPESTHYRLLSFLSDTLALKYNSRAPSPPILRMHLHRRIRVSSRVL